MDQPISWRAMVTPTNPKERVTTNPVPALGKYFPPDLSPTTVDEVETSFQHTGVTGGQWAPQDCQAKQRVAILVPYRNRLLHLPLFLRHMHSFLQRQRLSYTIYLIEQEGELTYYPTRDVFLTLWYSIHCSVGRVRALMSHRTEVHGN